MRLPMLKEIAALFASNRPTTETGKNRIAADRSIIAKIFQEVTDLAKKNMQDWRDALAAADDINNPKWSPLQDIYDYLRPDAHLGSQIDILKGTVLSTRFFIRDESGKENEQKSRLFQKKWFYDLMSDLMDAALYGYTVVQLTDSDKIKFINIPRRNIIPQKNFIVFSLNDTVGVDFTDPYYENTVIVLKNSYKYGIFNDLVPQLIYKKYSEQAWARLSERWGLPLLTATTNKTDKKTLDAIEAQLKKLGEAAEAVLPEGTTMKVEFPANQTDPYRLFDTRIDRCNSEISKRLLGGTMVSDDGSSRSQSEVHERTLNEILGAQYRRLIEFTVNDQLLPILRYWGKDLDETDEFVFDTTEQISLTDQWNMTRDAAALYELDMDKVRDTFNLPIIGEKKNNIELPPGFNKPVNALALALAGKGISFPNYKAGCGHKNHPVKMATIPGGSMLEKLSELILEYLWAGKDTLIQQIEKAIVTGSLLRDGLFDGWGKRRLNISYDSVDHHALSMMEYNLFHFSAAREKASVFVLNELLLDKEKNGIKSFNDFKKAADPLLQNVDRNHLQTEYNFAVAVGQNASRYNQFIDEIKTTTSYVQYQTMEDDQVRPTHQLLDGRIFSLNDPEARRLWPPNDFGCRCEFIQFIGDAKGKITTGAEGKKLINWNDKQEKAFNVNRGDIGQVFLQNQQYIQNNDFADDINGMSYDTYGLGNMATEQKGKSSLRLDKSITKENVAELFKAVTGTDYMGFKDYLNRAIILNRKTFDEKTTDATYLKEKRHQLFPFVKDVIASPDEVYLFDWKKGVFQTNYVKHYKNMSIVVNTNLGRNNNQIMTWYAMAKGADKDVRRGLLIKRNRK